MTTDQTPPTNFCGHCGAPTAPGATFCGRCGYPLHVDPAQLRVPAFAPATHAEVAAAHAPKSHLGVWTVIAITGVTAMIALGLISYALRPQPQSCIGPCGPPLAAPLQAPHSYTSSKYGYSLQWYDRTDVTPQINKQDDTSIGWQLKENQDVQWTFTGDTAAGRDEQQIVESLQRGGQYSNASLVYTIPQAEIGYQVGYGNVYDFTTVPSTGSSFHGRLFIIAAIKNNVAVEMLGVGPYQKMQYSHANPSLSQAPLLFDETMNTVTWKGEPPL